ncbi:hypothetical protein CAL24_15430 [Bordetella genomosp. 2]|uniref:Amidase domain-containing protein n=1 Tax=Bordetella genomosp. 2 TaxID=1983456 RepID=A0A261VQX8_9BORD|nr:hypothetical protein CAL24_15430 [Bordetella genomosp. 2]
MTYHPASFAALSFHDARARFFVGTTSPAEYLDECLGRIRADKQSVRAWTSLRAEQAKREARESEARYKAGKPLSRIDGMPVGVKDLISTWDLPTTEGIRGNEDNFIDLDAPCIQALRAAGAIIVGKVTTTELGEATLLPPEIPSTWPVRLVDHRVALPRRLAPEWSRWP